jgi:hypothetical protein
MYITKKTKKKKRNEKKFYVYETLFDYYSIRVSYEEGEEEEINKHSKFYVCGIKCVKA